MFSNICREVATYTLPWSSLVKVSLEEELTLEKKSKIYYVLPSFR